MVTIKDVAREANVAISTVSNVLNNVNNVSDGTRQKVLEAVERLKYVPNSNARALKSGKKKVIGLFLPSVQGDFYRCLIQAIHAQCKQNGYILNVTISNDNTSEEIYGLIMAAGVSGAIIMNHNFEDDYIDQLRLLNIPVVFADRVYTDINISSITVDNCYGAMMAVEYLVELGHKKIGYFHGLRDHGDERERYRGYCDVMMEHDLIISDFFEYDGMYTEEEAYREITGRIQKEGDLPDAIFCANDEMAWGCIRGLQKKGIKVPEQVSVIGFDNNSLNVLFRPALTTIHTDIEKLGREAVKEMLRLIDEGESCRGICKEMECKLIVRESSCAKA